MNMTPGTHSSFTFHIDYNFIAKSKSFNNYDIVERFFKLCSRPSLKHTNSIKQEISLGVFLFSECSQNIETKYKKL